MDTTTLLMYGFHSILWIAMGFFVGVQFVHLVEFKLNRIPNYSNLRAIMVVFLVLFLVWALAVTGGFRNIHWLFDHIPSTLGFISLFLIIKILLKKKKIHFFSRS